MTTLNACDFAYPPTGVPIDVFYQHLYDAGVRAVQRYLWRGGKGVTVREMAAAEAVGIRIVYGYEGYASNWRGGAAKGVTDAADACAIADDLGIPHGEPIYYAVDEDAHGMGKLDTAVAYVHGANRPEHPARAYGSYHVAEALRLPTFQTYAWSGGLVSSFAALYQFHNSQPLAGGVVDYCEIRNPAALGIGTTTPEDDMPAPKDWDEKDWALVDAHVNQVVATRNAIQSRWLRVMVRNALGAFATGKARGWFNATNFPAKVKAAAKAAAHPSPTPRHGAK